MTVEFCVANTGIEAFANTVALPHFPEVARHERLFSELDAPASSASQASYSAYHSNDVVALGRLVGRIDSITHDYHRF